MAKIDTEHVLKLVEEQKAKLEELETFFSHQRGVIPDVVDIMVPIFKDQLEIVTRITFELIKSRVE